MTNTNVDNIDKEIATPRLVVCDLGELNWVKVEQDLILVDRRYVDKIERNHGG